MVQSELTGALELPVLCKVGRPEGRTNSFIMFFLFWLLIFFFFKQTACEGEIPLERGITTNEMRSPLARAHMASTDTENIFSVHNPLSTPTHTHMTTCHKILSPVVALSRQCHEVSEVTGEPSKCTVGCLEPILILALTGCETLRECCNLWEPQFPHL